MNTESKSSACAADRPRTEGCSNAAPPTSEQKPLRVLRMAELEARTGLRKSTLHGLMLTGDLPRSVRLGPRAVGWFEPEIELWLRSRMRSKIPYC